ALRLPYKTALPSVLAPDKSCFCLSAPESLLSSCQISSGSFAATEGNAKKINPRTHINRSRIFPITSISISKDRLAARRRFLSGLIVFLYHINSRLPSSGSGLIQGTSLPLVGIGIADRPALPLDELNLHAAENWNKFRGRSTDDFGPAEIVYGDIESC